ncbi:hypothetical protein O7635_12010 [Asanoa sp. WMMD1127]|uniref:hypothetical protein n=1 Tax=Asanoa sp. WMMD1127 TaxID=3016107 RepID=UPI002417CDCA|nr:hypothetical protein [Asanoa sp. WMMD1127]MDG4822576.1 hypothetical protein [Asanoa sp. WMMD1127]
MRTFTKRTASVAIAAAVILGASSAAWAWWEFSGRATVEASAASIKPIEVDTRDVNGLYPGAEKDLRVEIYNPNPFPVVITEAEATVRTEAGPRCGDAITVELPDRPVRVEPGRKSYTLDDAVRMDESVTRCQGADFRVVIFYRGQNAA